MLRTIGIQRKKLVLTIEEFEEGYIRVALKMKILVESLLDGTRNCLNPYI